MVNKIWFDAVAPRVWGHLQIAKILNNHRERFESTIKASAPRGEYYLSLITRVDFMFCGGSDGFTAPGSVETPASWLAKMPNLFHVGIRNMLWDDNGRKASIVLQALAGNEELAGRVRSLTVWSAHAPSDSFETCLTKLTNLETLVVNGSSPHSSFCTSAGAALTKIASTTLRSLAIVDVIVSKEAAAKIVDRFPDLESLRYDVKATLEKPTQPRGLLSMQLVETGGQLAALEKLRTLVLNCWASTIIKNIKSKSLVHLGLIDTSVEGIPFSGHFAKVLEANKETLVSLDLFRTFLDDDALQAISDHVGPRLTGFTIDLEGSDTLLPNKLLRGMTALAKLRIRAEPLSMVHYSCFPDLPASLEYLDLECCFKSVNPFPEIVANSLAELPKRLHKLKKITMARHRLDNNSWKTKVTRRGVEVEIVKHFR